MGFAWITYEKHIEQIHWTSKNICPARRVILSFRSMLRDKLKRNDHCSKISHYGTVISNSIGDRLLGTTCHTYRNNLNSFELTEIPRSTCIGKIAHVWTEILLSIEMHPPSRPHNSGHCLEWYPGIVHGSIKVKLRHFGFSEGWTEVQPGIYMKSGKGGVHNGWWYSSLFYFFVFRIHACKLV